MGITATDVIDIALAEVGYRGKKTNADLYDKDANVSGKYNKYAAELYDAGYYNGKKNGFDWCCIFVDWCIFIASGRDKAVANEVKALSVYGASVRYAKNAMASRFDKTPQVGDQVIFKDKLGTLDHTGLVCEVNGNTIKTIEGNVGSSVVDFRTYDISSTRIDGFVHPYYDEEEQTDSDGTIIFENNEGTTDAIIEKLEQLIAELQEVIEDLR